MKKHILSYAFAAFAALSCSSMASLQTQVYDDGLYTRPAVAAAPAEAVPVKKEPVFSGEGDEVDFTPLTAEQAASILERADVELIHRCEERLSNPQ